MGTIIILCIQISEYQSDAEVQKVMPEPLSHQKIASLSKITSLLQNNTMKPLDKDPYYINPKEDEEDENNDNHSDAKHADNRSGAMFPPRWKNPTRMFTMEMKPAGSSVKLKCKAEGKCKLKYTFNFTIGRNAVIIHKEPKIIYCCKHNQTIPSFSP